MPLQASSTLLRPLIRELLVTMYQSTQGRRARSLRRRSSRGNPNPSRGQWKELEPGAVRYSTVVGEADDLEPAAAEAGKRFKLANPPDRLVDGVAAGIRADDLCPEDHQVQDGFVCGRNA